MLARSFFKVLQLVNKTPYVALSLYTHIGCQDALGMESLAIPDFQMSASSQRDHHAAMQGRLNFKGSESKAGCWSARTDDANQWLQVDLGNDHTRVTAVATQGRNSDTYNEWVTKYKLQYSNDGVNFQNYRERGQAKDKVKLIMNLLCLQVEAF